MTTPTAIAPNGRYGPPAPLADKPRLLEELRAARTPQEYLAASLELFKIGDFTSTSILFDLVAEVRDPGFTASALRVLQSACTHDDLRRPEDREELDGSPFSGWLVDVAVPPQPASDVDSAHIAKAYTVFLERPALLATVNLPPGFVVVADRNTVLAVHDDSGRIVYDGPFAESTLP
ncbi:immunity 47 family protein [Microbacterium sp. cx-55]|uniref:Imm47 family immunity protein n=1 Tax=unclassified Microbacterium TaxID=2609290 RepID=UPI001CBEDFD7|nr:MULTISPECIES: Imm47 family immunity protein [unclassified Microbacterium]MBZ4488001.1 hypothetical protein [Microbacterium sp. cx-55]MCC4908960.1 immunity 47 family protein [Microbacterium sp. cx-59]UGB34593.1 immunity 47 family protein [Microbacterium sp. cx-55]